ncbi:hypothetical protein BD289DRAFT_482111 [Coniella lustricola]|uniref:Uncharacterized protein n=1 Tax=Coniella lustricola TaxID=2025994 RepID=A0A2T3AA31_9PEZI|nr:hypothetical protein BD289DRAFT_482111 [Coniella lustricola]
MKLILYTLANLAGVMALVVPVSINQVEKSLTIDKSNNPPPTSEKIPNGRDMVSGIDNTQESEKNINYIKQNRYPPGHKPCFA